MRDWIRAHAYWAVLGVVVVTFAVLVFLAFGTSHTKTVTVEHTKTVTRTVVKRTAAPVFNGSLSSLVAFLHPDQAQQVKCPAGKFPAGAKCFVFGSSRWYVEVALPSDAATS